MAELNDIKILKDKKITLRKASKDNHNGSFIFMTESALEATNFDAVKDEYVKELCLTEKPKSNDALFISNETELYFIEFKNGYIDNRKIFDLWLKIFDSLLIFSDIIGKGISYTRNNLNYILVYNEDKNPFESTENSDVQVSPSRNTIAKYFTESRAKQNFIRFNLSRFEKLYFKNVFTYNEKEFEDKFVQKYSI